MGILSAEDKERWDAIKYAYVESVRMSGMDSEDQAGQLMRQLASMRDGLESIRQVISRAIAASDDGAEERMDARIDLLRQSLFCLRLAAVRVAANHDQATGESQAAAGAGTARQKILVQHKVPRVLADLVKGQFHLMQEWLRPILNESMDNGRDLERLNAQTAIHARKLPGSRAILHHIEPIQK